MIPWTQLGLTETVFTWENSDDPGEQLSFAVDRLAEAAEAANLEILAVAIDPEFAASLPERRGLEAHRIERLLQNIRAWKPILICVMPDGTGLTVDGNHRYFIAWKAGGTAIPAYLVPESMWREYLIDFPHDKAFQEHLKDWSGIL